MPFPGEGITDEPFSAVAASNQEALASIGAAQPVPTAPAGFPPGMVPQQPAGDTGMPAYLSQAQQFLPPPDAALEDGEPVLPVNPLAPIGQPSFSLSAATVDLAAAAEEIGLEAPEEFLAKIYQVALSQPGLREGTIQDGLIWKVACKTGTLALSPGPGQIDVEQPLELTDDLFDDMVLSVAEKAFPYITVPETHANGALENTGYVREAAVLTKAEALLDARITDKGRALIAADGDDIRYLLAGIEFTEPEVRDKAARGSIPDTSIGVKFNYRNKRTGKLFKAAWEHLALTPVPWVDGLVPFGLSQEPGGVVDAEVALARYDGVYIDAPSQDGDVATSQNLDTSTSQGILPVELPASQTEDEHMTVEEMLAQETARREAAEARLAAVESANVQLSAQVGAVTSDLHTQGVSKRIAQLEAAKVPPAVLRRAQAIMLADRPGVEENSLSLSIQVVDGDKTVDKAFGRASEIVDYLLSAMPADGGATAQVLDLSAAIEERQEAVKAEVSGKEAVDAWEKENHPERFDESGKRIETEVA